MLCESARSEPFGLTRDRPLGVPADPAACRSRRGTTPSRLFLPAFGMLAMAAGVGAASWVERLGRVGKALVVVAITEGAISVAVMMPVPLSYYSPIVGGLPGRRPLGMEPTYYWDSLDREALDWLEREHPARCQDPVRDGPDRMALSARSRHSSRHVYMYRPGELPLVRHPEPPGEHAAARSRTDPRKRPGRRSSRSSACR